MRPHGRFRCVRRGAARVFEKVHCAPPNQLIEQPERPWARAPPRGAPSIAAPIPSASRRRLHAHLLDPVVHQHDLLAVARRSGRDHAQLPDGRPLQRRGGGDRVQPAGPAAGEGHSSTRHNRALRLHPGVPLRGREGERVARGEASADISTGSLRNSILPEWRATRIVPGQRAIAAVTEQPVAGFAKDVRRRCVHSRGPLLQ